MDNTKNVIGLVAFIFILLIFVVGGYFVMDYMLDNPRNENNNNGITEIKEIRIDDTKEYVYFDNTEDILHEEHIVKEDVIINIEGFADNTINTMLDYIHSESFVEMINKLLEYISPRQIQLNSNEFSGKTFVITGTLSHPRDYYQKIIELKGGKVSNSVSKKTYAVLIGKDAGSKAEKAYKFKNDGINIIILEDEKHIEDFLKIESGE